MLTTMPTRNPLCPFYLSQAPTFLAFLLPNSCLKQIIKCSPPPSPLQAYDLAVEKCVEAEKEKKTALKALLKYHKGLESEAAMLAALLSKIAEEEKPAATSDAEETE